MRKAIGWVAALALPAMLLTSPLAGAQRKPGDNDKDLDKNTDKTVKAGQVFGKVMAVYEDKRKIRIQVTFHIPKLNTGAVQQLRDAQVRLVQAQGNRDLNAIRQAQIDIARAQATLYTSEKKTQDVELQAIDDVVVRTRHPRDAFDEKGKPKKFTKKELAELKGPDPKLPGYKAEFGDLSADQYVQVYMVKKKSTGPAPKIVIPKGKAKGKDIDVDAIKDLLDEKTPQISMIVIVADPPPGKGG